MDALISIEVLCFIYDRVLNYKIDRRLIEFKSNNNSVIDVDMALRMYGDLAFKDDLTCAINTQQDEIKFSKYERGLLREFMENPASLLGRERLLDAISSNGSDRVDRNIDYLISRLRRKLGDSPRNPRYISTQYGEGYLWIAREVTDHQPHEPDIYLSVGPIYGLKHVHTLNNEAENFVTELIDVLKKRFGAHYPVVKLSPDSATSLDTLPDDRFSKYALELSFLTIKDCLTCNLIALNRQKGQIFGSFQHKLTQGQNKDEHNILSKLADEIFTSIWETTVFRTASVRSTAEEPLTTSLYKASLLFEPGTDGLDQVEEVLRDRLRTQPEDHEAAILLATTLHNQMFLGDFHNEETKHQEIENLVMQHLPYVQDDALFLSAAAERLFALGHHELAINLAERAIDIGPSLAACYMTMGRINVMQGFFAEGIAYYDHAMEMCMTGSVFYKMLYTMKCIAYQAMDEQDKVREMGLNIVKNESDEFVRFGLQVNFFGNDPEMLPPHAESIAKKLPMETATNMLRAFHYVSARLFTQERHRENVLKNFVNFFRMTHGDKVIPMEVRQSIPGYLGSDEKL